MVNDPDYRLYLDSRFGSIDKVLDSIKTQTTLTNSRVTHLEDDIKKIQIKEAEHIINCPVLPRVEEIEDEMSEYRGEKRAKTTMKEWGGKARAERRADIMKTLQTIGIVIAAIGLIITAINTFNSNSKMSQMDNKVDMINVPVRTRSGIELWPSGVVIDTLQSQIIDTNVQEPKEISR